MNCLFRDEAYFLKYIEDEKVRIEKFNILKSKCVNEQQVKKCNIVLINLYKNMIYCMCSIDKRNNDFYAAINSYISLFESIKDDVADSDFIDYLAIKYLFAENSDDIYNNFFIKLEQLSKYKVYNSFMNILKSDNINQQLQNFMYEEWYNECSEYPWYNAHLRDNNTYVGYISFVASAIAKRYKLNIDNIKYVVS